MTLELQRLVREAATELGAEACRAGKHRWSGESEGGRTCPHANDDHDGCGGSQAVYRCLACGTYDYGEPGGPGALDCAKNCAHTAAPTTTKD